MRRLRTLSTRRLYGVLAVVARWRPPPGSPRPRSAAPPPRPIRSRSTAPCYDALRAPDVDGVSARVTFTNGLLPGGSIPSGSGSPRSLQGAGGPPVGRRRRPLPARAAVRRRRRPDRRRRQAPDALRPRLQDRVHAPEPRRGQARAEHEPSLARRAAAGSTASRSRGRSPAPEPGTTAGRPSYTRPDRPEGRRRAARRRRAGLGRGPGRAAARRDLRAGPRRAGARADGDRRLVRPDRRLDAVGPAPAGTQVVEIDPPAADAAGRPTRVRGAARRAEAAGLPRSPRPPSWPGCRARACGSCAWATAPAR